MWKRDEWIRCKQSPSYFLRTYGVIQDPSSFAELPFALWDSQEEILKMFQENRATIILKARQLGISWLVAGYATWVAIFFDNANILLLSKREDEAQKLLDKVKFIFDHLPDFLQPEEFARNNSSLILTGKPGAGGKITKGSRVTALPATEDAGRSETGSLIIADEWAFHPYADVNYAAFRPAISAGGAKFIGLSTANGIGTFFHEMWVRAKRGQSGFAFKFLPWFARPDRDERWYELEKAQYPSSMQEFYQEFPGTEDEAFIAAGGCVFDMASLNHYVENTVKEPIPVELIADGRLRELAQQGVLKVYENPMPWNQYVAGFDPAQGLEKGDESAAEWINANTKVQVAEFASHWDIDLATRAVHDVCRAYNSAFLAVERNNHGHTVLYILEELGYHSPDVLYYSTPPKPGKAGSGQSGFTTGFATKKRLVDLLIGAVREGSLEVSSREWVEQAKGFIRQKDGTVCAIGTAKDDRCIAMGLAWLAFWERPIRNSRPRKAAYRTPAFRRG